MPIVDNSCMRVLLFCPAAIDRGRIRSVTHVKWRALSMSNGYWNTFTNTPPVICPSLHWRTQHYLTIRPADAFVISTTKVWCNVWSKNLINVSSGLIKLWMEYIGHKNRVILITKAWCNVWTKILINASTGPMKLFIEYGDLVNWLI